MMDRGQPNDRFPIYADQRQWLGEMTARYKLPDEGKTVRALITYAMREGDPDQIFGKIRCSYCG